METTTRKEYCGAKIFDCKKTAEYFLSMCDVLGEEGDSLREEFVNEVKDLFDRKITSDDGEYPVYKISKFDLDELARNY